MVFPLESPLDGSKLSAVEATNADAIADLVRDARAAQAEWHDTPLSERIDALLPLKKRILQRAEVIADLVHRECGKPIEEAALGEVLPNADLVDYWCENIEELLEGHDIALDPISYPGKRGRIQHDARGVVALITPWNYPVSIPLRTLLPALLSGNAVVFKPSEITPRSGALVADLFAGLLPKGILTVVQGGADVGRSLVAADVDLVVFTGSVATGKTIAVACAERLIPCSLELGGKDAAIVMKDCDVERAAQGIAWGAFTNAGQNCAAVERVYVHSDVAKEFTDRLVAITDGLRPGIDTAVMTTAMQRNKVAKQLDEAIAKGGDVLSGGTPDDDDTLAFPPTIVQMDDVDDDAQLLSEETFGPLLPIQKFDEVDDAIERVNASRYGLTTSIWSKKSAVARELAAKLRTGIVTINNHGFTAAIPAAPWTGVGDTGYGITNSPHALHAMTRVRFVLEDRNRAKRELWWYPYTPVLRTIAFSMAKLKGGASLLGRIGALFKLLGALPKRLMGG